MPCFANPTDEDSCTTIKSYYRMLDSQGLTAMCLVCVTVVNTRFFYNKVVYKEVVLDISIGGRGQGVAAPQFGKYSFYSGKFFSKTLRVKLLLKGYLTALTACEASFKLFSMVY